MNNRAKRGFSLIELMVVMVIIGILSMMVIFHVSQDRTQQLSFDGIGEKVKGILQYAKSKSIYSQSPLALMVSIDGFFFMEKRYNNTTDAHSWRLIDDPILTDIKIAKNIKVQVESFSTLMIQDKQALTIIDPNGLIAPFAAHFEKNQHTISVIGSDNGQVYIERL